MFYLILTCVLGGVGVVLAAAGTGGAAKERVVRGPVR